MPLLQMGIISSEGIISLMKPIIAKLSEFVLIGLIGKRFKYNPQNGFVSQSLTDKSIKGSSIN